MDSRIHVSSEFLRPASLSFFAEGFAHLIAPLRVCSLIAWLWLSSELAVYLLNSFVHQACPSSVGDLHTSYLSSWLAVYLLNSFFWQACPSSGGICTLSNSSPPSAHLISQTIFCTIFCTRFLVSSGLKMVRKRTLGCLVIERHRSPLEIVFSSLSSTKHNPYLFSLAICYMRFFLSSDGPGQL